MVQELNPLAPKPLITPIKPVVKPVPKPEVKLMPLASVIEIRIPEPTLRGTVKQVVKLSNGEAVTRIPVPLSQRTVAIEYVKGMKVEVIPVDAGGYESVAQVIQLPERI